MLRMDEINKIRKDYFVNNLNPHQIAMKYGRSWATINEYITLSEDNVKKRGQRPGRKASVVTSEVIVAIEGFLQDEITKKVHRKQRYTSKYIFTKLKEDGIYKGSERTLRKSIRSSRDNLKQNKKKTE